MDKIDELLIGCARFPQGSWLRSICEGSANLPSRKINALRQHWGLEPLSDEYLAEQLVAQPKTSLVPSRQPGNGHKAKPVRQTNTTKPRKSGCGSCGGGKRREAAPAEIKKTTQLDGYGPGSQLIKLFESWNIPHCDDCIELAAKMDAWGVQGCRDRIEEIVSDILPRAKEWVQENKPWIHRVLISTSLEDVSLSVSIRTLVQKAIRQSERASAKLDPAKSHAKSSRSQSWMSAFKPVPGIPRFITTEMFETDTKSLISRLPTDIAMVAGVSRSGLHPATMLAMLLHVPMSVVRHKQNDFVPAGNGWRLDRAIPTTEGKILVVDDTTMTGNSLKVSRAIMNKVPGEKIFASIYCNPNAVEKPDLWAVDLPWPHLLEWNLFNSVLLDSMAMDFDGILCEDCLAGQDDDGLRYLDFLENTKPKYLPRKSSVPMIITARLEKYRPQTERWMRKWNIHTNQLIMGPWKTLEERHQSNIAEFKAKHFASFARNGRGLRPKLFVESDPRQARVIASITKSLVVCPTVGRCFNG